MLKVFISLILAASVVNAQDELSDFSVVHKLQERDQKNINFILKQQSSRFTDLEKRAYEVQLADVVQSALYRGFILKGTQLVSLVDNKTYYTPKDIYVIAYTKEDNGNYHYIKNENGTVTHKVRSVDISNINVITQMYESPLHYKPIVKVDKKELYDKEFKFETEFKLHLGFTSPAFMNNLTQEKHYGQTARYELIPYILSNVPYQFGLALNYESTSAQINSDNENYLMRAFSIGPSFKSKPFDWLGTPLVFLSEVRSALYSNVEIKRVDQSVSYSLAQTSFLLGIEKVISTSLGKFIVGINFQRQWSKASSEKYNLLLDTETFYDDSIAFHFGHGSSWTW